MKNTIMLSMLVSVLVIASIAMVSAVKPISSLNPDFGFVANGASCADQQKNSINYNINDSVWVKGSPLDSSTTYEWEIVGQKGDASGDPDVLVANGTITGENIVCFNEYKINNNDFGLYKLKVDEKQAGVIHVIPEFSFYIGALTLVSALGVFFLVRRK